MIQLYVWLKNFVEVDLRNEEGQTAVEYAMVIALVAIALAIALAAGGKDVFTSFWDTVKSALNFSTR
jgi:Flp pilus assembly pilin Flp